MTTLEDGGDVQVWVVSEALLTDRYGRLYDPVDLSAIALNWAPRTKRVGQ